MKLSELRTFLGEISKIYSVCNNTEYSQLFNDLSKALKATNDVTVTAAFKKINKHIAQDVSKAISGASCKEFSKAFQHLSNGLKAAKSATSAKELQIISDSFKQLGNLSALDGIQAIETALNKPVERKASKQTAINHKKVRSYADQLTSAEDNRDEFNTVLDKLNKRGEASAKEVYAIANEYLGGKLSFKTKKAAIEAIKQRFSLNMLHESRARTIERVAI